MNVMALLDYLQEEVEQGSKVPLSTRCMVDREKCLDIINDIRQALPNEIMEAETIRNEKNQILYDAEKESESIIAEAEEKVRQMVEEHKITQMAYKQAEEIITNAQAGAQEIRTSANEYVEDILADLETYIQRNLDIVHQNREQMKGR
jgi:vacuolar-type H+-ATPase subunit H